MELYSVGVRGATGAVGTRLGNRLLHDRGRVPRAGVLVLRAEPLFLGLGRELSSADFLRVGPKIGRDSVRIQPDLGIPCAASPTPQENLRKA